MRYRSSGIFSLTRWSGWIQSAFHEHRFTQETPCIFAVVGYRTLTCSGRLFQGRSPNLKIPCRSPSTPQCEHCGLGWSRFARRYLGNQCLFLFLWLLRCFSSPGSHLLRGTNIVLVGSPIRKSPSQGLVPARRGLSQVSRPSSVRMPGHSPCTLINLTFIGLTRSSSIRSSAVVSNLLARDHLVKVRPLFSSAAIAGPSNKANKRVAPARGSVKPVCAGHKFASQARFLQTRKIIRTRVQTRTRLQMPI